MIEISGGEGEGLSFGGVTKGKFEVAFTVDVVHEKDFKILRDNEVLITVVIEVKEEGGGAIIEPISF